MKKHGRFFLFCMSIVSVLAFTLSLSGNASSVHAAPPPSQRILVGQTPDVVVRGIATQQGHHNPQAQMTLNIGLAVRNSDALNALIAAASNPKSPSHGHYLTQAQYIAQFAPLLASAQAVRTWATSVGFTVLTVSPDHLLVTVRGTTRQVEQAFHVTMNDYKLSTGTFWSNDRDVTVPANLDIRAISGLNTFHHFHTMLRSATQFRTGGYYPGDFRTAYNMGQVGDGSGQTIGFTLWGTQVPQSDLDTYATNTNTPRIVSGQSGANGIDWIAVNGGSTDTNELLETAMDVEIAHGVAANSHLKYWLSDCAFDPFTGSCNPGDVGLEQDISDAANDSTVHVVSNSWGGPEAASLNDPFVSNTNASLQHAASVGTTFYFSSGDGGFNSGGSHQPSYPADSPYVVSVGGTTLNTTSSYAYTSESAWDGSGGGCSSIFTRPTWQTGVGAATCTNGRAVPDVAADADPSTGAYVYVQGSANTVGGTSLAAPLWTGMAADLNQNFTATNRPLMGFAAPWLYEAANNATKYANDFHDVTSGNNGYSAGTGWDEATGWGSVNLTNLAADWSAITRGVVLRSDGSSGYALDGYGNVTPFGGASAVSGAPSWTNWDIARGIVLRSDGISGYVLDGWGGIHPFGGAPAVSGGPYWPNWDIARGIVLRSDGVSGYVLDGWGGVHPFGGAPAVSGGPYWPNWDIARAIVLRSDGISGYVLDGWGGVHPFGGAPTVSTNAYWPNWDIARGIVLAGNGSNPLFPSNSGYVLDGWGGVHPFGGAPAVSASGYWQGQDRARGMAFVPALNSGVYSDGYGNIATFHGSIGPVRAMVLRSDGASGYVLDGYGNITPFGGAPTVSGAPSWPNWDIARGIVLRADGVSGYVLDGWGGVHPFGGAPTVSTSAYWQGQDIARGIVLRSDGISGYVLDGYGGIHPFGGAPAVSGGPSWPNWDIARAIVLRSDGVSGYVLDGWGGIHPFGGAPPVSGGPYWPNWDIARGIVLRSDGVSGYVLDGWGGVHPFGGAPSISMSAYWQGQDVARGIALVPGSNSAGMYINVDGGLGSFH